MSPVHPGPQLKDSLDLIRGSLDQVDSTVDIKWVQPRVLDLQQLETLAKQFEVWSGSVGQTAEAVEGQRVQANQGAAELKAM
jgi:26S proteasome regulatory subunit N9